MKKIISLFQRNYDGDHLVRNEITPGAEWVVRGEGTAYRKWDGTCAMIKDDALYKRYDVKKGRTAPANFVPAQEPDAVTGHWPGWVPVTAAPEDRYFREGLGNLLAMNEQGMENSLKKLVKGQVDGTYELCGPRVEGNPEGLEAHYLLPHDLEPLPDAPRDFEGLRRYFTEHDVEGIVWHAEDERMVKIKAKDFGIRRTAVRAEGATV